MFVSNGQAYSPFVKVISLLKLHVEVQENAPVKEFLVKMWQLLSAWRKEFGISSLKPVSRGFNVDGQVSGFVEVIGNWPLRQLTQFPRESY